MAITVYTYNDKVLKNVATDKWLKKAAAPLPPIASNTVRVRTSDGNAPTKDSYTTYQTATLVQGTSDIYDVYKVGTDFSNLLGGSTNVVEVLGANTTGITNMGGAFGACSSLTTVPLFDTSSVTNMSWIFYGCSSLTSIPLFDTSSVTDLSQAFNGCTSLTSVPLFDLSNVTTLQGTFMGCSSLTTLPLFNTSKVADMDNAFRNITALTAIPLFNTSKVTSPTCAFAGCTNVESGALALYNQMSTQTTPPRSHYGTFNNCGSNTTTGAAELAQIPSDWKDI